MSGRTSFTSDFFDGSEGGEKTYVVTAQIAKQAAAGLNRSLPRVGARVTSVKGEGTVVKHLTLKQRILLQREEDGVTTIEDEVAYRLPYWPFGEMLFPLVRLQLARIFRYRQRAIERHFHETVDTAPSVP